MNIKITSDSTCDLSAELIERYQIGIMPLTICLGDQLYRDGVDITPQDIFSYVEQTGELPKTSAPSVEDYKDFFQSLQGYDAIIHFNISSKASVSHANALAASKECKNVYVVDSEALSTGQGLLVLKACDLVALGKSPEDIVGAINNLRCKVNTSFIPDQLNYLHKGGRCSLAALMGAKVLKLHPMIDMKEGKLYAKKKYMGSLDRCIKTYIGELASDYPHRDLRRCFITHSCCSEQTVEKAKAAVKELFDFEEIIETVAGSTVTTHCGQGTLGVLFIYE